MRKVEVIGRRLLFDDVFKIEEARLRYERYDGQMSAVVRRLTFERGESAGALLVNVARRTVYLTEQFRCPALGRGDAWMVEIVAGSIDEGETPADCVKREIREETGFVVEAVEPIADVFLSPGGSSERIFLFCAIVTDAARTGPGGGVVSEGEDIQLVEWPVDEFLAKVRDGAIKDAKTLIAGYWLSENRDRVLASSNSA